MLRSPQVIATELNISPTTLRRWSEEFKDYLSDEANAASGRNHRRYHEADLTTLTIIRELMNEGHTYEQVRQKLQENGTVSGRAG